MAVRQSGVKQTTTEAVDTSALRALLLAEVAVRSDSNLWSLINIFNRVHVSGFPAPLGFTLFLVVAAEHGTHELRITARNPRAEEREAASMPIEIPDGNRGYTFALKLNFTADVDGDYELTAYLDGSVVGHTSLSVVPVQPDERPGE